MADRSANPKPAPVPNPDWLWGLVLFLTVILAYQPVWYAGFVWDDDALLVSNSNMAGLHGLREIWTSMAADICPLTLTTFWIEHKIWGLDPFPYHLVTIFMHGACAILLWRALKVLRIPGAWIGAALWTLHPVQVESVAWISEMKNTQSGLFCLLAVLSFVKVVRADDGKNVRLDYALTLLFSALAVASKASTVILPLVLTLCAWWIEGRWNWKRAIQLAPVFLFSIVAGISGMRYQQFCVASVPHLTRNWLERLATAGDAIWFYLGNLVWPHPLAAVYPRWQINTGSLLSFVPIIAAIALLVVLWMKRRGWGRPLFFAYAYFLVAIFPALGFVNLIYFDTSFVADQFQYLAGMGPLALVGAGLIWIEMAWVRGALVAGALLLLGSLSWQQTWIYKSDETLWSDTLSRNPRSWLADNNLGIVAMQDGQLDLALDYYKKALKLNPDSAKAHGNMGSVLARNGQIDDGIAQLRRAVALEPANATILNNLGTLLSQKGLSDESIAQFQKALEIEPDNLTARAFLGNLLFHKGDLDASIAQFDKALTIEPQNARLHNNLGTVLLQKGEIDEAISHYKKATQINPGYAEAFFNLAYAYSQKDEPIAATALYVQGLALDPGNAKAHNSLGLVFAGSGRLPEAIDEFQQALQLKPDFEAAKANLAKAQAAQSKPAAR